MYEELLSNEENTIPTYNDKIMIAKTENMHVDQIKVKIDALISDLNMEHVEIVKKIKDIVPEYVSNNSEFEKLDQPKVKVKKLKIS